MIIELAAAAFLIGSYVYHRLTQHDTLERGALDLPITKEGGPIPKIFGRCRVTTPVLAWAGPVTFEERAENVFDMRMNLFFVLGSGFRHGDGISLPIARNRIHNLYVGDQKLLWDIDPSDLTGNGSFETSPQVALINDNTNIVGNLEFLNGGPAQVLVNGGASTYSGSMMTSGSPLGDSLAEAVIPGYRNVLSALLYQSPLGFCHGRVNGLPSYQQEASSYGTNHPQLGTYARVGDDSNPVNVVYEILTSPDMLGLPEEAIDMSSFQTVQYALMTETHGYSRFWNARSSAFDMLNDVLRQIDGLLYFEQSTAKLVLVLIRNDFDPSELFVVDKSNCQKLQSMSVGGRTNLINKVRVTYLDREAEYRQKSVTAQNMANAVGQDGQVSEEVLDYSGCCSESLAKRIAERELGVRSAPIAKLHAVVQRGAVRLNPGDVVRLVWGNPDINAVFRIVGVERGTLEDGAIGLDLILDNSYVWRDEPPLPTGFGSLDVDDIEAGP